MKIKKRWERDSRLLSDGTVQYWVGFARGWERVSIEVLQYDDGYSANIYWRGEWVCNASWCFYDTDMRHVDHTNIPRCFAWLVSAMRERFCIDVPMDEV